MKISVLIPSRGRPDQLKKSVRSLRERVSYYHQITYVVGCDDDDPETIRACVELGGGTRAYVLKRRGSLGQIVNILAEQAPADVYCSWADDLEMLEPGWDQIVADALEQHPDWVYWWKAECGDTHNAYAVVPETWRKAAGRIFTDYFPCWFDDAWLWQTFQYALGVDHWVALDALVKDDVTGKTHRLHDYPFWEQFFWDRDGERLERAAQIAEALGWPAVENPERFRMERAPMFTQEQLDFRSEGSPPTAEYIAAFTKAKEMRADHA